MTEHSLRDRGEYALARAAELALARIPRHTVGTLGAALGSLARSPFGIRRETVERNLRLAFPDADDSWIERVVRESYAHLGREAISMIRLSRLSREEVIEATEILPPDWEVLQSALAENKGVLLVTGHYGNWEIAAAAVAARGVPIDAIVKRQRNRLVDAQVNAARARFGVGVIDMASAGKEVLRSLSRGRVVGIVADQDARAAGVFVPFFGIPSSTYRGPAMFALRFGTPLVAAIARRLPDGRYRVQGERVPVAPSGDLDDDVRRVTGLVSRYLEARIREDPGQYFWFHKRWKTAPPEEPGESGDGTNTSPQRGTRLPTGRLTEDHGGSA